MTIEKIKVQFINVDNNEVIGISEMEPGQLPQSFQLNTTLSIQNINWNVEDAIPLQSVDFIRSKSLILKLRKIESVDPKNILYSLPTISNELPKIAKTSQYHHFELTIKEDDWRQNEFLKITALPIIHAEVEKIKSIWENQSKVIKDNLTVFNKIHVRDLIGEPGLNLNLQEVEETLAANSKNFGALKLDKNEGFVENGFTFKTENTIFYGIEENNLITQFGISNSSHDSMIDIEKIIKSFNLVFVSWYHGDVIE